MKALLLLSLLTGVLAQIPSICPPGWQPNRDRCYNFVFYPKLPYDEAAIECQTNGAILLTVESREEHNFVVNTLRTGDFQREDWYTSAEKDTKQTDPKYVWTATNQVLQLYSPFWVTVTMPFNLDKSVNLVTYVFDKDTRQYGLGLSSNRKYPRRYICEISINEVYRIGIQGRDFDYGIRYTDINLVPRGPEILGQTKDTSILGATTKVYLDCIARGYPSPQFYWTRKTNTGTEIVTSDLDSHYTVTNGRLSIQDPRENRDAGTYQCVVTNSAGTIIGAPMQLSFAGLGEFPNVIPSPVRPKIYEGAVIECPDLPTKLAQDLRYQWKRCDIDDQDCRYGMSAPIFVRPELNTYIFNSGNGKLYFSEVTSADNGYYFCVATLINVNENDNYEGSAQTPSRTSKAILLNTTASAGGQYAPNIQDGFINVVPSTPLEGKTIRLECFAYGTGPLAYTWVVPIWRERYAFEDSKRILTIENAQLEDSGRYNCTVAGPRGSQRDSTSYVLQVEARPHFLLKLHNQHLDEGTSQLTWRCEARAIPFPFYTWYKNGEKIDNMTSGNMMIVGNTLHMTNLNKDMEGMYQCSAQNTHGVAFTAAQLRILSIAPSFDKYPMTSSMTGAVGGNVTILCHPEAAPFPTIEWFHNGGNLNVGTDRLSRIFMTLTGDLHITQLTFGDQGNYECRVTNLLGDARNSTYLGIVSRTTIYERPAPKTVDVNSTAYLYCSASHHASLDLVYEWAFNGRILNLNNHPHYSRGSSPDAVGGLYIRSAQFDHTGRYTCIARTLVDSANASAHLQVLGPPPPPSGLIAIKKIYTGSIIGENVNLADRDVLLMWTDPLDTHGSPIDAYMIFGKTNLSMEWNLLFGYVSHLDTIVPGIQDGQKRQFVVRGLKSGVSYVFRMKAINQFGVGILSKESPSQVVIPASPPMVPPSSIGGGGGSVGTLKIRWDPLPREDHNGPGIGYKVEWKNKPAPYVTTNDWKEDIVTGNIGEYSTTVGDENYFLPYNVRVTPFNIKGEGVPGYNDTVYSAEGMPIGIPQRVYAEPFNESALTVYWKPVPDTRDFMKGRLKGYKILYWLKDVETQDMGRQYIIYAQTDRARIIGLHPDTWYTVMVIVFNNAGNGLKSEIAHQQTDRWAPLHYPVHIEVHPQGDSSVKVQFRGVSTGVWEEPLLGYKIRYWRESDDIRNAEDVDCEKNTYGYLHKIQKGHLYHLRVLGYSLGGDGKMSSPQTLFSVTKDGVTQVNWDPSTTNLEYVYHDPDSAAGLSSCLGTILIGLMILAVQWFCRKA